MATKMKPRYLTKSRFKIALECDTKLFYTNKPEYSNQKVDDPFMAALAEGGYQVEELARVYHSGGVLIDGWDYQAVLDRTNKLLSQDKVIIYQAAFRFENLFIRADIIVKDGNRVDLIEVKAKSFDGRDSGDLLNAKGYLDSKWIPYIYDVAFQKHVITNAYSKFDVRSYLMVADKNSKATVDGLNQMFLIVKDPSGYPKLSTTKELSRDELGKEVLIKIKVDDICDRIYQGTDTSEPAVISFTDRVKMLSDYYIRDEKLETPLGGKCKGCEFYCEPEELAQGKTDGFQECWKAKAGFTDSDFEKPSMMNIWDFRKKDQMIEDGKYFMSDITSDDIGETAQKKSGMSRTERQTIQIEKAVSGDNTMVLLDEELKREMKQWKYPLHFIDFETTAVAIPFHANMRPYEGIAFQFSHHTVDDQGNIAHVGQYLNVEPGKFPNFEFVRALKRELDQDNGTIFRYAAHENSYLNMIYAQLKEATIEQVPDKEVLCDWIKTITVSTGSQAEQWDGERKMVDMCELVKRFYYDPYTNGSNSIKAVLPAVLNRSKILQQKYSKPIYGSSSIPSKNYIQKIWIEIKDGIVTNPYKLLPPLFEDLPNEQLEGFITDPVLAEGGAAMMAYAKMQFAQMSDQERAMVSKGLLKYCELDTFAMVLIWEFWKEMLS